MGGREGGGRTYIQLITLGRKWHWKICTTIVCIGCVSCAWTQLSKYIYLDFLDEFKPACVILIFIHRLRNINFYKKDITYFSTLVLLAMKLSTCMSH